MRQNLQELRHVIGEVNPLKSRLMDLSRQLVAAGCHADARSLDGITMRLEAWQARSEQKAAR